MSQSFDFQSIALALQHFWAERGCLIWQPYYSQVGAGTMNPATFLRVLGPEPWNVAYVEPSIRPDDGRYGENPNRMQQHYQFQVILKPDPGNPQELYIKSLEAVGIDPRQHDIRFVEDNWQQPALGAWGLGWEVWLDGQEITQYTYFQQAGGIVLDPVSVELTYGLDRIAIAVQRVRGFQEIRWNSPGDESTPGRRVFTAGDLNLQAEQEQSKYYFEVADVDRARKMYDLFEAEANGALAQGLVLPAYDYLLKCSHTFNILDARGAIGVTERQAIFGRMREIARHVSEAYLEGRQRLEYPWLDEVGERATGDRRSGEKGIKGKTGLAHSNNLDSPAQFLLEIGTEELPVGDLTAALEQLRARVPALLNELRLKHGDVRILGTPRRLVVFVQELAARQPDLEQIVKGPPATRAYDALGQPTQAAEGFARSKGIAVSDLQVRELDGGHYAVALVRQSGKSTLDVLAEALPRLITGLRFDKSMRWNSSNVFFSRPIRWLLALFGEQVVPFEYAGLSSGDLTRGLRFREPGEFRIQKPSDYFTILAAQGILLAEAERKSMIQAQVSELAAEVNGSVADDPALLAEVTNLVEAPAGLRGSFDASHLELPREVLISVMKKYQRYFPIEQDGKLLPYFITISNRGRDGVEQELVIEGNQHVIRARFADAAFFIREDLKRLLEDFLPQLGTLTFQQALGSMLDKSRRVRALVDDLAAQFNLDLDQAAAARRAAELCKADLVTKIVVEMTSLQGTMGGYYARHSGETEAVAKAIFEHYLPRFSGDSTPATLPGLVVCLADRLDTLAGLFAAGLIPTGGKDPFALRRAALGLVGNLIAWEMDFDLRSALSAAKAHLPIAMTVEDQTACLTFIIERLRNLLLEGGHRYDVVDAVVAAQGENPARAAHAVKELGVWVERADWGTILPAYARCVRITRDMEERYAVDPAVFSEPAENELYSCLQSAEAIQRAPGAVDDFLNAFLPMIPAINLFFDEVLVMTDDKARRENRLGLLQRIAALADGVADMSRLEGF